MPLNFGTAALRGRAGLIWRRIALPIILVLALVLPTQTRHLEISRDAENTIYDAYSYALAQEVDATADPDIVLLVYDDQVARQAQRTSPVDRELLAAALSVADRAGARAIGVDMAFIQQTPDEDALIDTLAAIQTPTYIIYADPETDRARYWDKAIDGDAREYQDSFWERISAGNVTKVSPVVGVDDAQLARHWPVLRPVDGRPPNPLFADAITGREAGDEPYGGAIAYSKVAADQVATIEADIEQAWGMFPKPPIHDVVDFEEDYIEFGTLQDKIVLIGVDTFNADQFTTPITRMAGAPPVAGMTVHAQMVRQALDNNFPRPLPFWSIWVLAACFALTGIFTARIERRPLVLIALIALQAAAAIALPVVLHFAEIDILSLPLFGLMLGWLIAFLAMGYALRSRSSTERAFARNALGKFLPADVAREILNHPEKLDLEGEERELYLMFTDLQGFTSFSHGRNPRETAEILNRYLEEMSDVVLAHRGTLDKYVGDAIVAFWGAPLASPDDAKNAVACAVALKEASERLREELREEYGDTLGRTRIGVNYGPVVVGNFGGKRRIQYTAMGDAMNVAARLEGASKYLGTDILVSEAVMQRAPDFAYRAIGAIEMSGVKTGVEVFEPLAEPPHGFLDDWNRAIEALRQNSDDANDRLGALKEANPDDRALDALIKRADAVATGRPYVLESK